MKAMEGLLPMMYKAIKNSRRRSRYECLSSGAPRSFDDAYVAADTASRPQLWTQKSSQPPMHEMSGHHRRHRSMGEYAFGTKYDRGDDRDSANYQKEARLMRFKSQRSFRARMFSCVGVA